MEVAEQLTSRWPVGLEASRTISSRSALLQTAMTCRPRPVPHRSKRVILIVLTPQSARQLRMVAAQKLSPKLDQRVNALLRTFALRGALYDTRQIQQLDLGIVVVDNAGDARQSGELQPVQATSIQLEGNREPVLQCCNLISKACGSPHTSYAAASEEVPVKRVSRVDLPTDGKPTAGPLT